MYVLGYNGESTEGSFEIQYLKQPIKRTLLNYDFFYGQWNVLLTWFHPEQVRRK